MIPAPSAPTCQAVQEALPAYRAGEREFDVLGCEAGALAQHVETCDTCRAERDAGAAVQGWLADAHAPAADTGAAGGLQRLLAAAAQTPQDAPAPVAAAAAASAPTHHPAAPAAALAPAPAWRGWLASAAAALLVAGTALGVGALDLGTERDATPVASAAPTVAQGALLTPDGGVLTTWSAGVPAVAGPDGATVVWAGRRVASLRPRTVVTAHGDTLRVDAGATLLHVTPGHGTTTVATPHATVAVLGTILLVDVSPAQTLVAVYEGRVQVAPAAAGNPILVSAGRAVAVATDRAPTDSVAAPTPPDWLPPTAALHCTLDAPRGAIVAGQPAWLRVTLTNDGPGCVVIAAPNARDPNFAVELARADDAAARSIARLAVRPESADRAAVAGLLVLGPGETYVVKADVGSSCSAPGSYDVVARYAAGPDAPAGTFVGTAASHRQRVEVTR